MAKTKAQVTTIEESSKRWWWLAAALTLGGFLGATLAHFHARQQIFGVTRTALVVSDIATGVQALSNEAVLAAQGNPGAIDKLRDWRQKVGLSISLLERGGYAAPSDPAPVLALMGEPGIPLAELNQGLNKFDEVSRRLQDSASQLREVANAETRLNQSLEKIPRVLDAMQRSSQLNQGAWGDLLAPHRGLLTRSEMRTMRVFYEPLKGAETLQTQWAQQFRQTAEALKDLNARAQSDSSLSENSKTHIQNLVQQVEELAASSAILAQSLNIRLMAKEVQAPIRDAVNTMQGPIELIGDQIVAKQINTPLASYLGWGLLVLGVLGGGLWIREGLSWSKEHQLLTQEGRSGGVYADAVDRITRLLRRAQKDNHVIGLRLEEDQNSVIFPLVSVLNSILGWREKTAADDRVLLEKMEVFLVDFHRHALRAASGGQLSEEQLTRLLQQIKNLASELVRFGEAQGLLMEKGVQSIEMNAESQVASEEIHSALGQLRELAQSSSKRLKRLAEGTQSTSISNQSIKNVTKQVKVLSMNTAIEAASLGDVGRSVGVFAQEIQRLSESIGDFVEDMDGAIHGIQGDVQEVIDLTEKSTSEIVKSEASNAKLIQSLRAAEAVGDEYIQKLQLIQSGLERQIYSGNVMVEQSGELHKAVLDVKETAKDLVVDVDKGKAIHKDFRRSLDRQQGKANLTNRL